MESKSTPKEFKIFLMIIADCFISVREMKRTCEPFYRYQSKRKSFAPSEIIQMVVETSCTISENFTGKRENRIVKGEGL